MKLIECPRDAWQGLREFIPTSQKVEYLNKLLRVGFDTIDFGSFVSPRTMPQVSDTAALISSLSDSPTKLLAIVANERGAVEAGTFERIDCLGYPFSISETFQLRNTNATIGASFERVKAITSICQTFGKELVIYISMGFGNPYGDPWDASIVMEWIEKLAEFGIKTFSLADTVGQAHSEDISELFKKLITKYPAFEFGAHFHTRPNIWEVKVAAAYEAGCRRFDGALLGFGGCPMAQDDLVGNMPTEQLITFADKQNESLAIDHEMLREAREIFIKITKK